MLAQETPQATDIDGYVLRDISTICTGCSLTFVSSCLVSIPPITEYDSVEADLHRVLPDAGLRASMIAICPDCGYAGWAARFRRSTLNPELLPDSVQIEHSKRFALAVKTARSRGMDPLDIAYIALNGLYCAREAGEDAQLWLELAAYEQSRGMSGEVLIALTGQDHLIMAELWRQLSRFDEALKSYELAAADEDLLPELIAHQKMLAVSGNCEPTLLPPYLVRALFPESADATARVRIGKNGRPIPPVITRVEAPSRLAEVESGPPDRRTKLSSAIEDQPNFVAARTEASAAPASESAGTKAIEAVESVQDSAKTNNDAASGAAAAAVEPVPVTTDTDTTSVQSVVEPTPEVALADAVSETVSETTSLNKQPEKIAEPAVPLARVSQLIAVPQSGSSVSLVQASQVNVTTATPAGARALKTGELHNQPAGEPANLVVEPDTHAEPKSQPRGRRVRNGKPKEEDPADRFPEIQITDEDASAFAYGYEDAEEQEDHPVPSSVAEEMSISYDEPSTNRQNDYSTATSSYQAQPAYVPPPIQYTDESSITQPAAAATSASGGSAATETQIEDENKGDVNDAIARVEGFLSLTRLPSYQSWIRGYRK